MVRKVQLCALVILSLFLQTNISAHPVDDVIRANKQFKSSIVGISVKEIGSKNIVYQRDAELLVHPASTLKLITSSAALNYLGSDYQFKTILYTNKDKMYLKLGGDSLFTQKDMIDLVSKLKVKHNIKLNELVVDDSIVDKIPFGTGWQWDDNSSIYFPQMSPYILNNNIFTVQAKITPHNKIVLQTNKEYGEKIINKLNYSATNNAIKVDRNIFSDESAVVLSGTIKDNIEISIPTKNPQKMYISTLKSILKDNNITFFKPVKCARVNQFPAQALIVSRDIKDILKSINTNSNNLSAEILIKYLGAYSTYSTGTTLDGLKLVYEYYDSNGINIADTKLVDASGTSMNDYVTADFMTNALLLINNSKNADVIKNSMADGLNGTFKGRLTELNGNLKVKTGTLANTSAVVGYIKTKSDKNLVFAIMLDNLPDNVDAKQFENELIEAINKL